MSHQSTPIKTSRSIATFPTNVATTFALVFCVAVGILLAPTRVSAQEISKAEMKQVLAAEQARIKIVQKISQPTIAVFGPDGGGGGSGVVITPDGYALTNFHVTKPCGDYMHCGMSDGKLYDAVIVGLDPTGDVALIKLLGRDDFPTAELGDSDRLSPGDWCIVAGNPFLLAMDLKPTITYGIISGVHRYQYPSGTLLEYADCIQTDASINPGNSGGPLFNADGQLVGINGRCSFEKRGRVNVGVGYAISINQIKKFYGYLKSGRIVDHATLGATVGTDDDGRVVVTDILESSDAYRRGLRYEDEIVSLGGKPVRNANEFKNILGTYPRGWKIPMSFRSEGERHDVLVRLAGVHSRESLVQMVQSGPKQALPADPRKGKDKDPRAPEMPKLPDLPETLKKIVPDKRPAEVARQIESRRGYANFYFNQTRLNEIWKANQRLGDLTRLNGEWVFTGKRKDGSPFEIILRDDESFCDWPKDGYRISLDGDLDRELGPDGTEGTLLAISLWRRLMVLGPQEFGDVMYLGTVPADDSGNYENQNDVLVATHDATESHFHFAADGELKKLEMFPTVQTDPCEIEFNGFVGGIPTGMTIRHGGTVVEQLSNIQIKMSKPLAGGIR